MPALEPPEVLVLPLDRLLQEDRVDLLENPVERLGGRRHQEIDVLSEEPRDPGRVIEVRGLPRLDHLIQPLCARARPRRDLRQGERPPLAVRKRPEARRTKEQDAVDHLAVTGLHRIRGAVRAAWTASARLPARPRRCPRTRPSGTTARPRPRRAGPPRVRARPVRGARRSARRSSGGPGRAWRSRELPRDWMVDSLERTVTAHFKDTNQRLPANSRGWKRSRLTEDGQDGRAGVRAAGRHVRGRRPGAGRHLGLLEVGPALLDARAVAVGLRGHRPHRS